MGSWIHDGFSDSRWVLVKDFRILDLLGPLQQSFKDFGPTHEMIRGSIGLGSERSFDGCIGMSHVAQGVLWKGMRAY